MLGGGFPSDLEGGDEGCSAAAVDRRDEWRRCCERALGLADDYRDGGGDDCYGADDPRHRSISPVHQRIQIVSLLPSPIRESRENRGGGKRKRGRSEPEGGPSDGGDDAAADPWMEAALQLDAGLDGMVYWISKKRKEYASAWVRPDEASLVQSTVSSFAATTATEIEDLRQVLLQDQQQQQQQQHDKNQPHYQPQWVQHRGAIVQILLDRLRREVAEPFRRLQGLRARPAVHVWSRPLECGFYRGRAAAGDGADSGALPGAGVSAQDYGPRRFEPERPAHRLQARVWESYHPPAQQGGAKRRAGRPASLLFPVEPSAAETKTGEWECDDGANWNKDSGKMPAPRASGSELRRRKPFGAAATATAAPAKSSWARIEKERGGERPRIHEEARDGGAGDGEGEAAVLERESAQLQLAASSDLDAVQRVERQMVDITGLLSQFASLVSDQSAELTHIRSAAESAKGDLDEGRENLAEARERAEASRHYLATLIVALGLLLLLFHWVRP
jgi:hypothetical protein